MKIFDSPFGDFKLGRWPDNKNDNLQAWDAADEYLLEYLHGKNLPDQNTVRRILIVNDSFGALSCALNRYSPVNWSDSKISHQAAKENCRRNAISCAHLSVASTDSLSGEFDLVLIRMPKALALLEDQLQRLRPHLHSNTIIIAAAMVKHLPGTAYKKFENIVGTVVPSLARKKARLLFVAPDNKTDIEASPFPTQYTDPLVGFALSNHASVFSRDHLDHGARFFLQHYSALPEAGRVADLACGNGVLGIMYQKMNPASAMVFIDESYMAIASTKLNYGEAFPNSTAVFQTTDGLQDSESESLDLILCNPPFHQQHTVSRQIASRFFRDSKRCLQRQGQLWVVANRHLNYDREMQILFGNCRFVARNKKFFVLRSLKR
ncbi:hypothetical protein AB833_14420 [Chromatiales bacterium (ex Bugula neritina AB1)]|nr:hypothetical protein AB833_14420 [Chromatiales bacterium (ex Bugula neritina AB1)]